jgi:hypothetical protein
VWTVLVCDEARELSRVIEFPSCLINGGILLELEVAAVAVVTTAGVVGKTLGLYSEGTGREAVDWVA